jgi:hypothetical protein
MTSLFVSWNIKVKTMNTSVLLCVAQRSKALYLSVTGVTTDTLVRNQAVSQPAVIGSPIG